MLGVAATLPATRVGAAPRTELIQLPPGFSIDIYTDAVPNARQLALSPMGVLFVGTRQSGKVYAVVDRDGDRRADRVYTLAKDLFMPSGVAYRNGDLYVAEVHRVIRFRDIEARLDEPGAPEIVYDGLPGRPHHGWKFIAFGPDGKLYVPVGAPCNVCEPDDPYGTILRMNPDGSGVEVFARGVRNSVGFTWHPDTGDLWFTDNGRDNLGDDSPPCELNRAPSAGLHFGFPYVHGRDIRDPRYGAGVDLADYVAPARELGAHVAPLGIEFYSGSQFPRDYAQFFIAEHGSWNRSRKSGYRVSMVRIDRDGNAVSYETFAAGWKIGEVNWGRPVDLEIMSDGSMLLSDDQAGAVYRIRYDGTH